MAWATIGGGTYVEQGTLMANNSGAIKDGTNLYVGSVPNSLFSGYGGVVPAQADGRPRRARAGHAGAVGPWRRGCRTRRVAEEERGLREKFPLSLWERGRG